MEIVEGLLVVGRHINSKLQHPNMWVKMIIICNSEFQSRTLYLKWALSLPRDCFSFVKHLRGKGKLFSSGTNLEFAFDLFPSFQRFRLHKVYLCKNVENIMLQAINRRRDYML